MPTGRSSQPGHGRLESRGSALLTEKGDKQRFAYFTARTTEALQRWLRARDVHEFHGNYKGGDRVFGLGPWGLGLMVEDLGRRAGIHATAHMFRHTSATWRVLQGVDASSLMQIMGWAGPEMMGVYTTLAQSQLQARALATSPLNGFQVAPVRSPDAATGAARATAPARGRFLPARNS